MQLIIAAILALTPLLILPAYFFYYDITPKVAVVLTGAAVGLLFLPRVLRFDGARRLMTSSVGRWFSLLAAAQLISLLLSAVFSSHPALSWNGGNWRRFGVVSQSAVIALGLLIAFSDSKSGLRTFLRATSAAGLVIAVYGTLQYFGVDPFLPAAGYHIGDGITAIVRPPSTLGHADYFAGHLLYVVFLGAALAATDAQLAWKALGIGAVVVGVGAIVLSGTRGAMLGLGAGAISLSIWNRARFTGRRGLLAAGACAICLAFYFSGAGLKLRARSQWAMEDLQGGARLWLWRDSLRMASQHLLLGFGPETFGMEFPRYQSEALSRAYPDFYHESPHNIFIDALVSQGVLGLGILVGFATLACFAAKRAPYLASALVAGLIAGLFVSFTIPAYLYFIATMAMLAADNQSFRTERVSEWYSRPLSLAAAAMFLYLAVRLTVADLALHRAQRDLDAGRIEDAVADYARSTRWHPAGSSDDLYFSRALAIASRTASNPARASIAWQQAFMHAWRAAETSEELQNAWYSLAGFYAAQNDGVAVEACLRHSVDASPNWFQSHWALGQILLLSGRPTEAAVEADRAARLDGGKDPEITKFLQTLHHRSGSSNAE